MMKYMHDKTEGEFTVPMQHPRANHISGPISQHLTQEKMQRVTKNFC
jgi:hypothetical protein